MRAGAVTVAPDCGAREIGAEHSGKCCWTPDNKYGARDDPDVKWRRIRAAVPRLVLCTAGNRDHIQW
jgi:hypothetical protein